MMSKKKTTTRRIAKRLQGKGPSPEQMKRLAEIRKQARQDFPPSRPSRLQPATTGIGAQLRAAREARGLTWYAVAKSAGIPNPATVRDIECGRDAKLSNLEAVATALGMQVLAVTVEG
jgi:hypothetical protein